MSYWLDIQTLSCRPTFVAVYYVVFCLLTDECCLLPSQVMIPQLNPPTKIVAVASPALFYQALPIQVCTALCIVCFIKEIEQKQLTWYGHVQRMAEGRLPKIALKWMPKQKRARGRPKKNWMEGIENIIIVEDITDGCEGTMSWGTYFGKPLSQNSKLGGHRFHNKGALLQRG